MVEFGGQNVIAPDACTLSRANPFFVLYAHHHAPVQAEPSQSALWPDKERDVSRANLPALTVWQLPKKACTRSLFSRSTMRTWYNLGTEVEWNGKPG